jgi:hypothetical protein
MQEFKWGNSPLPLDLGKEFECAKYRKARTHREAKYDEKVIEERVESI